MTEIKDTLSLKENEQFKVLLTEEGRKIYFAKECLDEVTVLRRINEEPWKEISRDVRTPFFDTDKISTPAYVEYKLLFKTKGNDSKVVKVHLP